MTETRLNRSNALADHEDMSVAILTALELIVLSSMLGGLLVKRSRAAVVPARVRR